VPSPPHAARYAWALALNEECKEMAEALGDRTGMDTTSNNLDFTLEKTGDLPAAVARALVFLTRVRKKNDE
jgi:hypothetical protein